MASHPPWASGPGEILRHALELLKTDSDINRRLAMISIDNAVELMIKVYLGLPKRITGLKIPRKQYQEFAESFPLLLDALETHASDKIVGVNVGEIEWYHRLRNELYHQGNGLTVEREKVEVYAQLANILFEGLFGIRLFEPRDDDTKRLGEFIASWAEFEQILTSLKSDGRESHMPVIEGIRRLRTAGVLTPSELATLDSLRQMRNQIVHAQPDKGMPLTKSSVEKLRTLSEKVRNALAGKTPSRN
jgi:hypothetical protein